MTSPAFTVDYEITQITNNDYHDVDVEIYGSKLAWLAYPEDSEYTEIFYYDGKKMVRLTENNTYECPPSISSGGIAWQAYRKDVGTDVFLYDYSNINQLTNDKKHDFRVTIYNNKVVWCKQRKADGQIMIYDGDKIIPIKDAYAIFPRVSSGGIMYSDILTEHLYVYNWNNIIDLGESDVEYTAFAHNQQINGNKVVWRKYIDGFHEVFLFDILTGTIKQVTKMEKNPTQWSYAPVVNGQYIAWKNKVDNMDYLRLYDGREVLTIASGFKISEPCFGDGFLVWAMSDSEQYIKLSKNVNIYIDMEVFTYKIKSKEIIQITNDNYSDTYPVASDEYIAWQKYDDNDFEIYLAHIN